MAARHQQSRRDHSQNGGEYSPSDRPIEYCPNSKTEVIKSLTSINVFWTSTKAGRWSHPILANGSVVKKTTSSKHAMATAKRRWPGGAGNSDSSPGEVPTLSDTGL